MLATFAFDVCHDVYRVAREAIDSKIPTLNLEASGKYTWHPDRLPRLAEFVADFALAGERALCVGSNEWGRKSRQSDVSAAATTRACPNSFRTIPSRNMPGGSRMTMFRVYYLGGAEYHAARRHLGISELTWADWAEEIRAKVGRELTQSGIFPPSKYFKVTSAQAS